jgi:hypothetical protein
MVDFGSEQGLSYFETAGIAGYVEDSAEKGCAVRLEELHCVLKRAKTPLWAKRCRLWMGT